MKLEGSWNPCRHFIGGEFVSSENRDTFASTNPATGAVLSRVSLGDRSDIDAAVSCAESAWSSGPWSKFSRQERADVLNKIGDLILANRDELAKLETLDTGKPLSETSQGDIPRAAANFHFFADLLLKENSKTFTGPNGSKHATIRRPIGTIGLITPWNLPLYLESWKIAPALAMGNSVILKPAELTPLSANALAMITLEAGLPPGVFNIVHGYGPDSAGQALVEHPLVKAISFTGETNTGEVIMASAAKHLKKLSFELGGKGASVLFADADLDAALPACVRASCRNQGQICLAGSRLLVHESIFETCVERLSEAFRNLKPGDPLNPETQLGSLVSKEHRDKVLGFIKLARDESLTIAAGGSVPEGFEKGAFLEPTLILNPDQKSALIQKEIFGPVLTMQSFSSDEEAIAMVNDSPYGLSASLWTESKERAQRLVPQVRAGMIWVNSWFLRNLETAFGGMKRSGVGREGGAWSLDFYSELQTVSIPDGYWDLES